MNNRNYYKVKGTTHYACDYILSTMGENAVCCGCNRHECQAEIIGDGTVPCCENGDMDEKHECFKQSHNEIGWEERVRQIIGNVPHKEKARHIINLIRQLKLVESAASHEKGVKLGKAIGWVKGKNDAIDEILNRFPSDHENAVVLALHAEINAMKNWHQKNV